MGVVAAIAILVLLAFAGLAAGWIKSPVPVGVAVAIFVVCVAAAAVLTALQFRRTGSDNKSATPTSAPVHCPRGHRSSKPLSGVIREVRVVPVNARRVCVSWLNPDDPDVGGFIVSQYPQDANGDKGPSGAPDPTPALSSQLIDSTQFVDNLQPVSGELWKVCVTPLGLGINKQGVYPTFSTRQGCSATFRWPS